MPKHCLTFRMGLFVLLLLLTTSSLFAQNSISGIVKDDAGPIAGVSVSVVGSKNGTVTDAKGAFTLKASKGDVLHFSYVGYVAKDVTVANLSEIFVALVKDDAALDDVVVTSFGIKKQERSLGYSTSTVTAKQLTEAGNTNFASALYGKAAGVRIATSPGGASSAVNVQIRGLNSLNFNAPPLYVVDGVILRNIGQTGAAGINNGSYFDDTRIRGNGILDVNPEDIESITVLKGASATALYGSDAVSGVIVITTKKGTRSKGLGVNFNYYGTSEKVAFTPKFQNIYGQGYSLDINQSVGATDEGWIKDAASPSGVRPNFRAYANFGPAMNGQKVRWWDGSIRSYSPQPDNYKKIFQDGFSSLANLAVSNQSDNLNYRLSVSRLDYKSIQRAADLQKNTFNLNSTAKLGNKASIDLVGTYVNTHTHNRPFQMNRLASSYDGFFGREEDMDLVLQKYQTSQGYAWVPFNQTARNPKEAFVFNVRPEIFNFFWNTLRNTNDEYENRLYSSATLNWEVAPHLKFRGRVGNDYTANNIENRTYNQYPVAFNPANGSTGGFNVSKGIYSIIYTDLLLTYSNKITKDLNLLASGGYTYRKEHYNDQSSNTTFGLVTENFFSLNNSYGLLSTSASRQQLIKNGYFGVLNFGYKDFLFLEGTARQEQSSTLPPQNNKYFYPSVNGSFVFTDAIKSLSSFMSYGKLRASYGIVGNSAPIYRSNVLFSQSSLQTINGAVSALTVPSAYGNSNLKPEKKYEKEVGIEARFLNNRLGVDVTYYTNRIKNVILDLQTSPSNGASSQIINAGEIGSHGWEIALNGELVKTSTFRWNSRFNFAFNRSKTYSLQGGLTQLVFYSAQGNGINIVARPGEETGTIYVNPVATDGKGNKLVDNDGYYIIDNSKYVKGGGILPKVTGGLSNSFSYKNFSLDILVDYRFGGQIVSAPLKYGRGTGMYENTLAGRDAAHGGLAYYIDQSGTKVPVTGGNTGGQKVYNDGVLLKGVKQDGTPNTTILDAANYYFNSFQDGAYALNQEGAIYNNSFIKMREVTLGYRLPAGLTKKLHLSNLRFSLIGRNLFYFWRTLKNLDPEAMIGNQWYKQGVDEGSVNATRSIGFSLNATF